MRTVSNAVFKARRDVWDTARKQLGEKDDHGNGPRRTRVLGTHRAEMNRLKQLPISNANSDTNSDSASTSGGAAASSSEAGAAQPGGKPEQEPAPGASAGEDQQQTEPAVTNATETVVQSIPALITYPLI